MSDKNVTVELAEVIEGLVFSNREMSLK